MTVLRGDVREIAATLDAESFDGCLCDPPYGLSFMGKKWDYDVPSVETWAAVLGALKPGAHLLAFAGTRTQHRMAVRIEDAGFEIRDMIAWVYGSGFPKSLDVSKAIDKAAGLNRPVVSVEERSDKRGGNFHGACESKPKIAWARTSAASAASAAFDGYGTALKPALEPITVARKPLRGTVAANVLEFGTGAINVDGCRVDGEPWKAHRATGLGSVKFFTEGEAATIDKEPHSLGRWPANLIHDGSEEVVAGFPESKDGVAGRRGGVSGIAAQGLGAYDEQWGCYGGAGSAARFFYCAKASRSEREAGLEGGGEYEHSGPRGHSLNGDGSPRPRPRPRTNHHPTVKPIALAEYLARLILPPKRDTPRRLLVPFSGSGSEVIGALRAGWDEVVGIELSPEYAEIAEARIAHWTQSYQAELVEAV